jgi:hypothetical protein
MDHWLILLGVLLPLAPFLQLAERRVEHSDPRPVPVPVEDRPEPRRR